MVVQQNDQEVLTELSLFTGYAGFSLGLRLAGVKTLTLGYCDNDKFIQKLITKRIDDGLLDDAPIIGDICTFDWSIYRGLVGLITAGFPCQPHSQAGRRQGEDDPRNLWPNTRDCISKVGSKFVMLENVAGLLVPNDGRSTGYAATVIGELSELGYDCRWGLVSAASTGAPHRRSRWWCLGVANTDCDIDAKPEQGGTGQEKGSQE